MDHEGACIYDIGRRCELCMDKFYGKRNNPLLSSAIRYHRIGRNLVSFLGRLKISAKVELSRRFMWHSIHSL
ncbi:hypothetical protein TSUD_144380 [Trifolium subterraneum]|uniref:Uncharacterized protein n=1 Tax=Trifolium subterraneum TaxID=3900 RepID=A0A2Z6NMU2_TRISU|nr:hypothetical protein TSUD_144380 [Trifolium subterraneum]